MRRFRAVVAAGFVFSLLILIHRRLLALLLRIPQPHCRFNVQRNINIETSDGILLVADHFFPAQTASRATILIRSPYGRNRLSSWYGGTLEFFAGLFAERGYHVMVQDVRGRFASGGEFDPYLNEKRDGLETVSWLRQQTFFSGKLILWGTSYLGMTQWVIAHEVPELIAMMPIFSASELYPVLFPDGILNLGLLVRWMLIFDQLDAFGKRGLVCGWLLPFLVERRAKAVWGHLPVADIDTLIRDDGHILFQRLPENYTPYTRLWDEIREMTDVEAVTARVDLIGGWYDFFLSALLNDYTKLKNARKDVSLTIGPWQHFNTSNGLMFGFREGIQSFDDAIGGKKKEPHTKPVRLYVCGSDKWIEMEDFPPHSTQKTMFLGDEMLTLEAPEDGHASYQYDPLNPTPAYGGAQFSFDTFPVKDNRSWASRDDVLCFTSEPLETDVTLLGTAKAFLTVQSTCESADFFVRICDVQQSGESLNVCDGIVRVQENANSERHSIEIMLSPMAYCFKTEHRIQVLIASAFFPHRARNPGTSEPYLTSTETCLAVQTVFWGHSTPSRLELPVYPLL